MKRYLAAAAACLLLLAGCGGGIHPHIQAVPGPTGQTGATSPPVITVACPPGRSFMGCAVPHLQGVTRTVGAAPAGCKFPDVSSFQGHPDWPAVKAWQLAAHCPAGAVFKLGEYVEDPDAVFNATELHALGMIAIGYWFVRNTGCAHESDQIIAEARALHLTVVAFDAEVPEARGYAACLKGPVRSAGLIPVEYTGPGTNPDSTNPGLDEWVAAYGPSHPPCVFICSVGQPGRQTILAWQETDGRFGFPVDISGLGAVDVSVDFGLLALAAPPAPTPKPSPFAVFPAKRILIHDQRVSERNTVATWWSHGCSSPVHRAVCRSTRTHLVWLAGRLVTLAEDAALNNSPAQPTRRYDWKPNDWGVRHYRIERILHGKASR